jgi:hypothetical protein
MTASYPQMRTTYPQSVYSPFCLCRFCSNHAFWSSLSAMSDVQILERAKGRAMTEEQEKFIESIKLRVWNASAKGEKVG